MFAAKQLNGFNHVFRRKVIYTVGAIDCKVHSYVNVVLQRISIPTGESYFKH